jgi:tRNA A-37 threonylcarbamoyl transferase component Bud32
MQSSTPTGTVLAGFRVEAMIGAGAMGAVYLAEDSKGRRVALKLLAPELARDERFRQRFLRESELVGSLDHPHIVPTLAAGEDEGVLYLAMAYVEGSDLRELLRREGRLEPRRAIELIEQVAGAVDAAHAAGLVHRDVKPGNILIAPDAEGEHAYVCDFGLARHISSVSSLTSERGFLGTIDYVPPEQIEGRPIDGRADVYSLGCVLYECLAGGRPFERESELSVVFAHLNEPPPRLSDLRPELPSAFDGVFESALAKSPDGRYSTCGELVDAAWAALRGKRLVRRKIRRRRFLAAAVAVVAAAGLAIGGVVILGGTGGAAPSISQSSIAGAKLGLEPNAYMKLFGGPGRRELVSGTGHTRLTFDKRRVAIYFKGFTDTAVEVTTWNKAFRTAEGIGPCSTIAEAKKAYGRRFEPSPWSTLGGRVYAYTVGKNLIFAAQGPGRPGLPSEQVSAVALYYGAAPEAELAGGAQPLAAATAINEHRCQLSGLGAAG